MPATMNDIASVVINAMRNVVVDRSQADQEAGADAARSRPGCGAVNVG
jgi:hypothetical protein